jgi:hypothetical protein
MSGDASRPALKARKKRGGHLGKRNEGGPMQVGFWYLGNQTRLSSKIKEAECKTHVIGSRRSREK